MSQLGMLWLLLFHLSTNALDSCSLHIFKLCLTRMMIPLIFWKKIKIIPQANITLYKKEKEKQTLMDVCGFVCSLLGVCKKRCTLGNRMIRESGSLIMWNKEAEINLKFIKIFIMPPKPCILIGDIGFVHKEHIHQACMLWLAFLFD